MIASDPTAHFDDYVQIASASIPPVKNKNDDATQAEDEQAIENGVTENGQRGPEDEDEFQIAEPENHVSSHPKRLYASDPRIIRQHDEQGRRLLANSDTLQCAMPPDQIVTHVSHCQIHHCPSCQTYGQHAFQVHQRMQKQAHPEHSQIFTEHPGDTGDLQREAGRLRSIQLMEQVAQPEGRRSTTPPGFGPNVHDGIRSLSDVLALHNRVEDMGLSREAAQSSFLYSHETSEKTARGHLDINSIENTSTQAMPSLSWNDAKRRDAYRRSGRSQSADGDLDRGTGQDTSTGLGITGIVVEQELARNLPTRYQTSSTVPLPNMSAASSVVQSPSEGYESEPGEDGILGGDEEDEDGRYDAEDDDVESNDDDEAEEEEEEDEFEFEEEGEDDQEGEPEDDGDSQTSYSTMLCDSDGQQIPEAGVISRRPRQLMDLPPFRESLDLSAAVSVGAVQNQSLSSGMLRDSGSMNVGSGGKAVQTGGQLKPSPNFVKRYEVIALIDSLSYSSTIDWYQSSRFFPLQDNRRNR